MSASIPPPPPWPPCGEPARAESGGAAAPLCRACVEIESPKIKAIAPNPKISLFVFISHPQQAELIPPTLSHRCQTRRPGKRLAELQDRSFQVPGIRRR